MHAAYIVTCLLAAGIILSAYGQADTVPPLWIADIDAGTSYQITAIDNWVYAPYDTEQFTFKTETQHTIADIFYAFTEVYAYDNVDGKIEIQCYLDVETYQKFDMDSTGIFPLPDTIVNPGEIVNQNTHPLNAIVIPLGTHTVTCYAEDSSGNRSDSISYTIEVKHTQIQYWIHELLAKTCSRNTPGNDETFLQVVTYLIEGNVIEVEATPTTGTGNNFIPTWAKGTICLWSAEQTSDDEFINAMEFLVRENVIRVN